MHAMDFVALRTAKSGVRDFRETTPSQADLDALLLAGDQIQEMIAAAGNSENEIVADFERVQLENRCANREMRVYLDACCICRLTRAAYH